jgi:predicted MFS family arabinose efflux permease
MLGIDFYHFYMPIYSHTVGLSASAIGMVLGAFGAAAIVVRIVLPAIIKRYSMETVLTFSFYLSAASFVFFPLFTNAYALALLSFALGLGLGCGQPIVTMLTFDRSAAGRSGEALGLRLTVNHLTRVVAPVMFGSIASGLGLLPTFWITASMLGGAGLLGVHKAGDPPAT